DRERSAQRPGRVAAAADLRHLKSDGWTLVGGHPGGRDTEGVAPAAGRCRPVARLQAELRLGGRAELRRGPGLAQAAAELLGELCDRDPRLVERVAVAQGDCV